MLSFCQTNYTGMRILVLNSWNLANWSRKPMRLFNHKWCYIYYLSVDTFQMEHPLLAFIISAHYFITWSKFKIKFDMLHKFPEIFTNDHSRISLQFANCADLEILTICVKIHEIPRLELKHGRRFLSVLPKVPQCLKLKQNQCRIKCGYTKSLHTNLV